MALALGGIVVRLAVLQVRERGPTRPSALSSGCGPSTWRRTARRSSIATAAPLAITLDARDVYANPTLVTDPVGEADTLAPILGVPRNDVTAALRTADSTFAYVDAACRVDVAHAVADLALPGIGVSRRSERYVPERVDRRPGRRLRERRRDGDHGARAPVRRRPRRDPGRADRRAVGEGQEIAGGVQVDQEPQPGPDLELTIDREMQFQAQVGPAGSREANHAKGGTVIVMDPRTGDDLRDGDLPVVRSERLRHRPTRAACVNLAVTDIVRAGVA